MNNVIFTLWVFCVLITVSIWLIIAYRFLKLRKEKFASYNGDIGISVIVCTKNGGKKFVQNVHSLTNQYYRKFEIIIVNDYSTDDTFELLKKANFPSNVRVINASEDTPGKKKALTDGILASHYDVLLLTDDDCIPSTKNWISSMMGALMSNDDIEIVLGYGPMTRDKSFINLFSRYETTITAATYITAADLGVPYMGVGRNLMYKKSLWLENNGFEGHKNIVSGDDDLFVQQAANGRNTKVNLDPDSFMFSTTQVTWTAYFNQKIRHVSTSSVYKFGHQLILGCIGFCIIGVHLLMLLLMVSGDDKMRVVIIYFSYMLLQMFIKKDIFKTLGEVDLTQKSPILDVVLVLYYLMLPLYKLKGKNNWK